MQWEYCLLTGIRPDVSGGFGVNNPKLYRFTREGLTLLKDFKDERAAAHATAAYIAALGERGWELVGTASTEAHTRGAGGGDFDSVALFFKRPKETSALPE